MMETVEEARKVLADQLTSLRELARFTVAHVASVVLRDTRALTDREFVEGIDLAAFRFDPEEMRRRLDASTGVAGDYAWTFDPLLLQGFLTADRAEPGDRGAESEVAEAVEVMAG